MTISDPLIGRQLGDYTIQSILGHGGMARVYHGYDDRLDRYAAVKIIDAHLVVGAEAEEYRERFRREARAIARLNHPNIVGIYQFGEIDNLYYMAMAFIEGQDLRHIIRDHIERNSRLPYASILRIVRDIADALDYAHESNVIHRDVKPSNIMVMANGRAVLTDFGLALTVSEGTRGNTFGSVHYIAPEQAVSSAQAVPQSDLYSLGIVLYEMLTGQLPFDDPSAMSIALKHLSDPPPPLTLLNPDISPEVEAVVLKVLAKEPKDRYVNGLEFIKALEGAFAIGMEGGARIVGELPTWRRTTEDSWHTLPFNEENAAKLNAAKTESGEAKTPTPAVPNAVGDVPTRSEPLKPALPPSWRSTNTDPSIASRPITEPKSSNIALLIIGAVVLGLAAVALVILGTGGLGSTDGGGTSVAGIGLTGTPRQTINVAALTEETTREVVAASPTRIATTAAPTTRPPSATPRPTSTPTAEPTDTPEVTEVVAVVPRIEDAPIVLRYNPDTFVMFNQSDQDIDVGDLTFVQMTAQGREITFQSDRWVGSANRDHDLQPGFCFQVWRDEFTNLEAPNYCEKQDSWFSAGSARWFWVSDVPEATFDVRRRGEVLATCSISAGECALDLE